jgi:hypothetical protein
VHRAIACLVEHLAAHATLLGAVGIEVEALEPFVVVRLTGMIEALAGLASEDAPSPRRGPRVAREATAAAVWAIIARCIARGRVSYLPFAANQLAFVVLAPYLGPQAAAELIMQACTPRRAP